MSKTALILGGSGRFGSAMTDALWNAGWKIKVFDREADDLITSAVGVDLIVNAWNPPYNKWADEVPVLTRQVIEASKASGARVLFPGNVYVYGDKSPAKLTSNTPHEADNPLGLIRRRVESMYRKADVPLLILRAGDYIDTQASGNWFDRIITKPLSKGRIDYPGDLNVPHAWAYLPDLARAGVALLDLELDHQVDVLFPGYTASGNDIAEALSEATGTQISAKTMPWWPIELASIVVPFMRGLVEMRYLWSMPHAIDASEFEKLLPRFAATPLAEALADTAPVKALADAHPSKQGHDAKRPQRRCRVPAT